MHRVLSLVLSLFFFHSAFADCIGNLRNQAVCPISVVHLQALKKLNDCRNQQIGSESCAEGVRSSVSSHPAYTLLGFTNANRLDPAERTQLVRDFLNKNRQTLLEEVSKAEFESRIKAPRRISQSEISQLLIDYRNHATRTRLNPSNAVARTQFNQFKNENRELLSLVSRTFDAQRPKGSPNFYQQLESGGLRSVRVQVYRPMMVGGVDIANASYETVSSLPDKIRDSDGKVYDKNSLYRNHAERVVDELEKQLLAGKSLNEALESGRFNTWSYSRPRKKALAQVVKDVAINSQIDRGVELNEARVRSARYLRSLDQSQRRTRTGAGLKRIGIFGGAAALSVAAGVAGIVIENQRSCDQAFPYTPTRYRQPFTTGLSEGMRCQMVMPQSVKDVPAKVKQWMFGNELDALVILNSFDGGNSPCTYVTSLYNAEFCSENSSERTRSGDGSARSTR